MPLICEYYRYFIFNFLFSFSKIEFKILENASFIILFILYFTFYILLEQLHFYIRDSRATLSKSLGILSKNWYKIKYDFTLHTIAIRISLFFISLLKLEGVYRVRYLKKKLFLKSYIFTFFFLQLFYMEYIFCKITHLPSLPNFPTILLMEHEKKLSPCSCPGKGLIISKFMKYFI